VEDDTNPGNNDFKVRITQQAGYARLTLLGEPAFEELLSLFHVVGVQSGEWPHDVLLIDLRGVSSRYPLAEEYRVGQEIVTSLGHLRRIASVVPTERITRLAERAARRSWLKLRVFDDKEEAVRWLLDEGEERQSA
jgi:hypothetical protein